MKGDLSAAFANDIQGKHFWPYYPEFVDSFGGAFLKIKYNPENIQAGYVALAQMVRMIMRSVGMISHKKSLITIFGHKLKIKKEY